MDAITIDPNEDVIVKHAISGIREFVSFMIGFLARVPLILDVFWHISRDGRIPSERFFDNQKRQADESNETTVQRLRALIAFSILCMASGVYLAKALKRNFTVHVVAFTLRPSHGGLIPILSDRENLKVNLIDITMLAADIGIKPDEIPSGLARSSFDMIADEIRSTDQEAAQAVQALKQEWKIAALGTDEEWRSDYTRMTHFEDKGIEVVLVEFGPTLIKLSQKV
ncbi:hypothetical protein J7T55_009826 [Diaporthe amygdali]|uniref:uncharacterized protein n=1 Tax=Phomopsis amygdali TaxID=1214568 RepID=UPI0022FDF4B7|nr:uncharacterized protein J7T55_009826 [Diaporthe amygdali]KAJ0116676.1 hypothetical protein J7T55_009826 [Diaporthe amygdali]